MRATASRRGLVQVNVTQGTDRGAGADAPLDPCHAGQGVRRAAGDTEEGEPRKARVIGQVGHVLSLVVEAASVLRIRVPATWAVRGEDAHAEAASSWMEPPCLPA